MANNSFQIISSSPASVTYDRPRAAHSVFDNVQGQVFGVVMTAFGIAILHAAGLITGQAAGLAFVISYATGLNFGLLFFLVNLPFYFLALARIGVRFTVGSLIAVTGISVLSSVLPSVMSFNAIDPFVAAVLAGFCVGIGVIGLFRHGASGGGVGILAYYIQQKTDFRAGWLQALFDLAIFSGAAFVLDWQALLASALGAAVLNAFVAFNHRADWYVAR
ncbi:YitT family protein [Azospirillum sp. TSO35-2]|uniref:YitT family protein n=1 Tax=Azospirillum sp. TSO35-2 TaxID=716796 RepID=UPI001FFFCFB8|nr:YitT family protein [Azospirillum sp. TSO35-2]